MRRWRAADSASRAVVTGYEVRLWLRFSGDCALTSDRLLLWPCESAGVAHDAPADAFGWENTGSPVAEDAALTLSCGRLADIAGVITRPAGAGTPGFRTGAGT
mmetsp:Transcript_12896/g.36373  ORF Transcript_12896/g.36373 Transcript_12896/m.36373 type:complete len:103 (-) Transcript_12896:274-582(-)